MNRVALAVMAAAILAGRAAAAPSTVFTLLHSFSGPDGSIANAVILDATGTLFGTAGGGGASHAGTVFKVKTDGTGFQVLRSFSGHDGAAPVAGLVADSNGFLYGTNSGGGANEDNCPEDSDACGGTIFKVKNDGTGFTVLHAFTVFDGAFPVAGLILDSSGYLYGTTLYGGAETDCQCGSVFKIKTDGTGFMLLHSFGSTATDGNDPWAGLVLDSSGFLYGTTTGAESEGSCVQMGGPAGCGNVFKVKTDGTGFAVLHDFSGPDGGAPYTGLVLGADGFLYGTTTVGGTGTACDGIPCGNIFKIKNDGTGFKVLHNFSGTDGSGPLTNLILDSKGNLYGTANNGGIIVADSSYCTQGCGTLFSLKTDGTGFTLLRSFTTAANDGQNPSGLIFDGLRNLYGTTSEGGVFAPTSNNQTGTVFKLALPIVVIARSNASPVASLSPIRVSGRKH